MLKTPIPGISLDAAGLVALADLTVIAHHTALMGTARYTDTLVLCPGLHQQQKASELNMGELPACAAMTTGYVFRVENQATVAYLQKVGKTGRLVVLEVEKAAPPLSLSRMIKVVLTWNGFVLFLLHVSLRAMSLAALLFTAVIEDWWAFSIILVLAFARLLNIAVIRRRAEVGWHGALEPGIRGDLLVLLSQDRWVRIQGSVDALKTVTSGRWLKEMTATQSAATAFATTLVYLDAAIAPNATQLGNLILIVLLLASALVLGVCNRLHGQLSMHGHVVRVKSVSKQYVRRMDLAKELIVETGREDWAIRLGMINVDGNNGDAGTVIKRVTI